MYCIIIDYCMSKKVILFDFDGTLFDSRCAFEDCSNQLAIKYRFKMHENWDQFRDMSARDFFSKVLKLSWYQIPFFIADTKRMFREKLHMVKPFDHIPEILKELNNFYELGLVTSNNEYIVKELLKEYDMDHFSYTSYDVSLYSKKSRIKNLIRKNDINPEEVIYVGDEYRDGKACNEANIPFVAVTWGFNSKKILETTAPKKMVDTPEELFEFLMGEDVE